MHNDFFIPEWRDEPKGHVPDPGGPGHDPALHMNDRFEVSPAPPLGGVSLASSTGLTDSDVRLMLSLGCSCALHLFVLFFPAFGTIAGFTEPESRYSQKAPSSYSVTLTTYRAARSQDWHPATESRETPALPAPESKPVTDERPNPAVSRMDKADLLPLPGAIYYPTRFLTLRPQPLGEADLDPPQIRPIVASGKVILSVWISPFGQTSRVVVESSDLPPNFVAAAVLAFERLRFRAGELHGQKVGAVMKIEVTYDDGRMIKTEISQ